MPVYRPPYPKTWPGILMLTQAYGSTLLAGLSGPVLLVALGGALLALRTVPARLVLWLPVVTLFLMLALPTGYALLRYVLPLTLFIDSFAAFGLVRLRASRLRPVWIPLLVLLCGWRLLIGLDLTYAQYYETRGAASAWFNAFARAGDRIGYFGVTQQLPHLPATIQAQRVADHPAWTGRFDHGSVVLHALATEGPEYVVIIPDLYSQPGMERSGDCPPEVYEALVNGTTSYRQVAFFSTPTLLPARGGGHCWTTRRSRRQCASSPARMSWADPSTRREGPSHASTLACAARVPASGTRCRLARLCLGNQRWLGSGQAIAVSRLAPAGSGWATILWR